MLASDLAIRLTARFAGLDLFERLAAIAETATGRIVFTTSLGLEDQAIAHAIFTQDLPVDVVTLDTGRLFPETYEVWSETEQRYGRGIRALYPDHRALETLVTRQGIDGFRASIEARKACCGVRKVDPLQRGLDGASIWITGLRAEQSPDRALADFAVVDAASGVLKVSPLFDWARERVLAFVQDHGIPYNALHDRGFLSIGCAPCTRAVRPGEPQRAGRWWWEQDDKKECGLHRHVAPALGAAAAAAQARLEATQARLEKV
jgi:phosphoadenosine phosphosulfate reductase